jgi:cell division protein FtsA
MTNNDYLVAFEIGSSKIKGAVGSVDAQGTLTIHAIKEEKLAPNIVRHGSVLNPKEVSTALDSVIKHLNAAISPRSIRGAYVSVGGRSLSGTMRHVDYALPDEREISQEIVDELIERAKSNIVDREVVEAVPGDFQLDNMTLANPIGAVARSIATDVLVVTCRQKLLRIARTAITDKLHLAYNGYVVRHTAIADMVLTPDERKLGVMLVDFGAETTTVSIHRNNNLCYIATLPMGSRNITLDLANAKKMLEEKAEELKKNVGCAIAGENPLSPRYDHIDQTDINQFVAERAMEIVLNIVQQIKYAGLSEDNLQGGIVYVGGGSQLKSFGELLGKESRLSTRQGCVTNTVRCSGSKLNILDDVDVVAMLMRLAKSGFSPCVEEPDPTPVVTPQPADDEEQEDELDEPFDDADSKGSKGSKGPGLFGNLWHGIVNVVKGDNSADDDDDDNLDNLV